MQIRAVLREVVDGHRSSPIHAATDQIEFPCRVFLRHLSILWDIDAFRLVAQAERTHIIVCACLSSPRHEMGPS